MVLDAVIKDEFCSIVVHLCSLSGSVEKHQVLQLSPDVRRFCIFSLVFSHAGNEILGGSNEGCLYVYDCDSMKRTLRVTKNS